MLKTFLFVVLILQQWLFLEVNSETLPYISRQDENKRIVKECKSYESMRKGFLEAGGGSTKSNDFPFMALIFYKKGADITWYCGGNLISSRFVLTAAHCFYGTLYPNGVRLGESDGGTTTVDFGIKNVTIHPDYDFMEKFNDIALVELDREVQFSENIMPACLPLAVGGRNFSQFIEIGWDYARTKGSRLHRAKFQQLDDSSCLDKVIQSEFNTTRQMCAGTLEMERDSCIGESGGPLFIEHPQYNGMFLIFGIISYSEGGCGSMIIPTIYTRVPAYVDWIESKVWGKNGPTLV